VDGNEILLLGLGIRSPWQLVDQHMDVDKQPHEFHLQVSSERGLTYACPVCGTPCSAHDFQEKTWRHLNFFQNHCYIHASVPRVNCPEHGVKLVEVPWARKGSAFTLLFEQAALALVREMPVNAAAPTVMPGGCASARSDPACGVYRSECETVSRPAVRRPCSLPVHCPWGGLRASASWVR
jgi:hypothetical protein